MNNPLALIIEDTVELARLFARAIEMAGFDVMISHNAEDAIKILATCTPDLALIDLYLPDLSGEAVIQTICLNPRLSETYVIVTSADVRRARSLSDLVDLVLPKPVNFAQLRDIAKRHSQQKLKQKNVKNFTPLV